jgi:RNA polymerase sigma factor for flagellar operon FliA
MMQMTTPEVKEIWKSYLASKAAGNPCEKLQKKLVEAYYGLVRVVAQRMHQKNTQLTVDEFTSMGVDGLYDAIRMYDPNHEKKSKFETYAMPRIRGSMLDEIRKSDWVPRLVRSNVTKLDRQRYMLESAAGRKLTNAEFAAQMNMSEEEFECLVQSATTPAMHSVNDIQTEGESSKGLSIEHIQDGKAVQPIERMLRKELFNKLMGKNFTKQEQKIVWLYYFEDLSMKEISVIVNLSESRVSQMHGDIRNRLRQKAERNPEYFADIWAMIAEFKETVAA